MQHVDASHWKIGDIVGYVDIAKPKPVVTEGKKLLWHIIVTEQAREKKAVDSIEELGLKTYWPRQHKRTPGGRRRSREIEVSLFPRRVLVLMPCTDEAFWRVKCSPGVVDFMRMADGHHLASLPESEIETIRKMEAKKDAKYRNLLLKAEKSPYFPRRKVWAEILPGRKMLGTIIDQDGQGRVNVLLEEEILGRQIWPVKAHMLQFADEHEMPRQRRQKKSREVGPPAIPAAV